MVLPDITEYSGPVTDYVGTADGGTWVDGVQTPSEVSVVGDARTYAPGHAYADDWSRGPLAPNLGQYADPSDFNQFCYGCAAGSDLTIGYNLLGDSEPDHLATFTAGPETYDEALYENGTEIFNQNGADEAEVTGVPADEATWREDYDTGFAGVSTVSQSTQTHTDLTFHYTPGSSAPSSTLPSDYYCDREGNFGAPCQVLPILTLNYMLAANTENTSSSPVQTMGLTVSHLSYGGNGSHAPVTSASVSVSFDGGTTWHRAALAGEDGHYTAIWANPSSAAGTSPELRVTATDAAGGSITQTITAAYTIAKQLP